MGHSRRRQRAQGRDRAPVEDASQASGPEADLLDNLSNSERQAALSRAPTKPPSREEQLSAVSAWLENLDDHEVDEVAPEAAADRELEAEPDPGVEALTGADAPLPHHDTIDAAFGRFDIGGLRAGVGGKTGAALTRQDADGALSGDQVGLTGPDLWTEAHEAAHAIQQAGGQGLPRGEGRRGDRWERHADAVADAVVAGDSAEELLEEVATPGPLRRPGDLVQFSGGLPTPPFGDDQLRGLTKEQLDELYKKHRKSHPKEAQKVKRMQKSKGFRQSSVKKNAKGKKFSKKAVEETTEKGTKKAGKKVGKKLLKKGVGFVARKTPLVVGFVLYDLFTAGPAEAANNLVWPLSELWTD